MNPLKLYHLIVLFISLAVVFGAPLTRATVAGAVDDDLQAGTLPAHWINGTDCSTEVPVQIHAYSYDLFILRQSLCTSFEAPFIYLIFGEDRVLMQDTGDRGMWTRAVVDDVIAQWLAARGRSHIELIVSHSHSHGDHVAGDRQFISRPNTRVVGHDPADVQAFFGIDNWPTEIVAFDLGGGRIVDVIPLPGHAHSALRADFKTSPLD